MKKEISIPEEVLQIGFFSDVHSDLGNVIKMQKKHPEVEYWFCAGDVVDMSKALHYTNPVLRLMNRLGIPSVIGNHDYVVKKRDLKKLDQEAKDYIQNMPMRLQIRFQDLKISVYHATPKSLDDFIPTHAGEKTFLSLFDQNEADIFIMGHTHLAFHKRFQGIQFVNPGALTNQEENISYCLLDKDGNIRFEYLRQG